MILNTQHSVFVAPYTLTDHPGWSGAEPEKKIYIIEYKFNSICRALHTRHGSRAGNFTYRRVSEAVSSNFRTAGGK
jgi:hypothetical protein